ncbi:MAG: hypothetical protein ABIS84_07170 [Arachnia sp.]
MPSTPSPALRRGRVPIGALIWGTIAAVVALVIVTIWATGGFGTDARPFLGSQVEPGEMVETRFWDVAVRSAEVVPDLGEIHVHLTVVNKQRQTLPGMTPGIVAVRLPDGVAMTQSTCFTGVADRFAPLIQTSAVCELGYGRNEVPSGSIPTGPFDVEVVVLDQELSNDLLTVPHPESGEPAGWVPLTVSVAAEGES